MKPKLTELLKPPFRGHRCFRQIFDADNICLLQILDDYILSKSYIERDEIRSLMLDFVAKAMNEKRERDYGKPMRWERSNSGTLSYQCPKCKNWFGA